MNAFFLNLVRMSIGSPFNFIQRQALLVELRDRSSLSNPCPTKKATIEPMQAAETNIDPTLESWSFRHSLGDSGCSDVDEMLDIPCHQSSQNDPDLSRSTIVARSSEDTRSILRVEDRVNASESLTIVSNDGKTSLVLDDRLIQKQRIVIECSRIRNSFKRKVRQVEAQISNIEDHIDRLNWYKGNLDTEDTAAQIELDIEHRKRELDDASKRKDALKWDLDIHDMNYECSRDQVQDMFEVILERANLLNLPEQDDDSVLSDHEMDRDGPVDTSPPSIHSDCTAVSMSELFRRGVEVELEGRKRVYHEMEDGFNERYKDLEKGLAEYHQDVKEGLCDLPQSEFDRRALQTFRQRTRDLIDAEALFEEVKSRARALGLLGNEWEQESKFVDDHDDGYHESYEAAATGDVNRDVIETWIEGVLEVDDVEIPGNAEMDEWDAQSIDICDSISCVDYTRNGARIDRWRDMCRNKNCEDALVETDEYHSERGYSSDNDECLDE